MYVKKREAARESEAEKDSGREGYHRGNIVSLNQFTTKNMVNHSLFMV